MYLEIVNELRTLFKEENLKHGDKIPSERVLTERLNVGRSTIREALRSLELLGLIETRRGEGTFLSDFSRHQLVEVLAAFVLQGEQSFSDVHFTRQTLEKEAIRLVAKSEIQRSLPVWESLQKILQNEGSINREDLIREILVATGNRLSFKIWFLLKQYGGEPFAGHSGPEEKQSLLSMIENIRSGQENEAIHAFNSWIGLLSKGGNVK
ncbi:FadR/GntR family transcriptional regulator [Chungangia koreensis]|uniref:FadR/GntR family transcriptional regulator n=1 Tax=Chungangia koreensis TaxID=752657 RepID=A0ABV8X2Y5_9LACT